MDKSLLPLCLYCQVTPAREGHLFCCDACQTLKLIETQDQERDTLLSTQDSTKAEDQLIKTHYGVPSGHEIQFTCAVERLACEACIQQLSELKVIWPQLKDLRWDRGRSTLTLSLPKDDTSPTKLFQFFSQMGLKPRWVSPQDASKDQKVIHSQMIRLGLTGALFGNIMLFAIPIYGGLRGDLENLFLWIQAFLFLPLLTWGAFPFYRTAWVSLKLRKLNTDLPLTLAFGVASLISLYGLFTSRSEWVYFDSLAGFLFLILLSRYLLERSLWKTQNEHRLDRYFEKSFYLTDTGNNSSELKHWKALKSGDKLWVTQGQRLPASGVFLNTSCELDTSWMSGEFWPHTYLKGAKLKGGSLVVSPNCYLELSEAPEESEFVKLLEKLKNPGEKIQTTIESQIGMGLIFTSFTLVFILFLFYSHLGFEELIKRSLALWIVACPCAVSFAAPLSRAIGSLMAEKIGFWIRDTEVFEKLHHVKKIAFDKTGTLTHSFLNLNLNLPLIDPHYKKILLSLENISEHPIAKALRQSLGALDLIPVTQGREIIGQGVEGYIGQDFYEVKKSNQIKEQSIELKKNGNTVLVLNFEEQVDERFKSVFTDLKNSFDLYILSGDHIDRVKKLSSQLAIPSDKVYGALTPEGKKDLIEKIQPDLYIGDGTNDILAMTSAPLSMSFGNASMEAQNASQMIMTHSDFSKLPYLFTLSLEIKKLLNRNLIIALTYNLVAGLCSLIGWIGPLEAAVLMPVASLALLISTSAKTKWLRNNEGNL